MNRTMTIKMTVAVVIAIIALSSWVTSGNLDLVWLRSFSGAVFVASLLLTAYDLWLWRLPPVQRIPSVPRNVRGTWQGTVASMSTDRDSKGEMRVERRNAEVADDFDEAAALFAGGA